MGAVGIDGIIGVMPVGWSVVGAEDALPFRREITVDGVTSRPCCTADVVKIFRFGVSVSGVESPHEVGVVRIYVRWRSRPF